ncbi:hypothetical protein HYY73_05490 [Candidatus Woesearchaeota archaeon]|nr:hypothetical protein [Candidatus Woesearchaeota archaeon]
MSETRPERPELERTVMSAAADKSSLSGKIQDNYIIYVQRDATKPKPEADAERLQRFKTLIERTEQLQQQYGEGTFICYRRFEYLKAIAAVIKDNGIVDVLKSEGYAVEKQGIMRAQLAELHSSNEMKHKD